MGQRTINKITKELTDDKLVEAIKDIKKWHKTAILPMGVVRFVASKLVKSGIADTTTALRLAEEGILLRTADWFVELSEKIRKDNNKKVIAAITSRKLY